MATLASFRECEGGREAWDWRGRDSVGLVEGFYGEGERESGRRWRRRIGGGAAGHRDYGRGSLAVLGMGGGGTV